MMWPFGRKDNFGIDEVRINLRFGMLGRLAAINKALTQALRDWMAADCAKQPNVAAAVAVQMIALHCERTKIEAWIAALDALIETA